MHHEFLCSHQLPPQNDKSIVSPWYGGYCQQNITCTLNAILAPNALLSLKSFSFHERKEYLESEEESIQWKWQVLQQHEGCQRGQHSCICVWTTPQMLTFPSQTPSWSPPAGVKPVQVTLPEILHFSRAAHPGKVSCSPFKAQGLPVQSTTTHSKWYS